METLKLPAIIDGIIPGASTGLEIKMCSLETGGR
jgi:hypothetical protein